MTKWTFVGVWLLASLLSSSVLAQAVVNNPGHCAQFYPSANCQNYGPGNPLYPGHGWYTGDAPMRTPVRHPRHHHYSYRR